MAVPSKSDPQKGAPRAAVQSDPRAERLAAALRENLKRRKAQARSQAEHRMAERKAGDRKPVDADGTDG